VQRVEDTEYAATQHIAWAEVEEEILAVDGVVAALEALELTTDVHVVDRITLEETTFVQVLRPAPHSALTSPVSHHRTLSSHGGRVGSLGRPLTEKSVPSAAPALWGGLHTGQPGVIHSPGGYIDL
jgi:hypothetical protein